ncbi:long-chain fatty acid--CoA ligase [Nocardia sp. 852002-20019_SCH5090214]|uniref:Acyl-CoA synthetase n=1 Tax=Nocardia nova TaxID=37330 RepID=A0A2S5ZZR3_9NOCA|nr:MULTISPECIES: long-chain fatty acid--CoA ligase [Nocardia]OBF86583.1 long-chain fatty acid--CoA ligase [Mycobacterium sp. 852002-51759_SCH5129042]MBF6275475.1 long-chain fatty acid--CoA ligase [Nocardia nova]OBA52625.1 long-chain fatty acid--CoA ligase [Nocardia sp. 852002-51101_SCH5132738]OBA67634.1 long-chain fatty acid--CoA ligase [Nocardia sp. 852002-20019_SCH5090214]OBB52475.1 long-chain fatty acid--CoA ligase [Nocardia sp. 852002-51244_SCH5132740]
MREFEVPATYTIPEDANMSDGAFRHAERTPGLVVFNRPDGKGGWTDVTAAEFAKHVTAVAKGLIASGIELGDRVAILASTRYEWVVLDFAIWAAGGCTVAIFDSSSAEQARWILSDSGTKLIVVENARHRATIAEIEDGLPELGEPLVIDDGAIDTLVARGKDLGDEVVHERRKQVEAASPASLIYTSGTTGRPKGVMLSHANLYAESAADRAAMPQFLKPGHRSLLFLPLAHVFARAVALAAFDAGVTVAHTADWSTLVEQFGEYKPDFILSVPRVFEKVFNGAKQKAHDGGKGKIFDLAADTAVEYSQALDNGGPGLVLKVKHTVFDKLVYGKLREAMGGRCKSAVSGGGPLGARLGHFFRGIGVTIYEGYGLTESTAAVSVNTPEHLKVGSVGRPLGGHAAKVADDGELLLRGPVVFAGYWNNPTATEDAFDDGWFKTGDLGAIDEQGFITITGRKKEIIVTAGGKNVSPAMLEDSLRSHPLISQVMVVGDGKPFVGALITLDPEALPGWKTRNNVPEDTPIEKLIELPELNAEIDKAVKDTNKLVSHAEAIKKTRILPVDWTEESGELTPKMSLKRNVVMKNYADEVEAIYG